MFAVGDKVFYRGKGGLNRNEPYVVKRLINGFLFIEGSDTRYSIASFSDNNDPIPKLGLMQELTKRVNERGVNICSYALEFDNGYRRFQIKDICHARLTFGNNHADEEERKGNLVHVALNVAGHLKQIPDWYKEAYKLHVKYIITQSPWRNAFLPKPIEEVYDSGVFLDIDKDYWYCVAAAIALRTGSEFLVSTKYFSQLLELGFSPNVSYVVSSFIQKDKFRALSSSHHVLNNTEMTMASIANFFNTGIPETNSGSSYRNSKGAMYKIFNLIKAKYQRNEVSIYKQITKVDCPHIAKYVKQLWGDASLEIDVSDMKNLVIVANVFAKEIK